MYSIKIAGVELQYLPPPEAVTVSGGGRPVNERKTIEGRIIATRSPLPASRRIQVTAPQDFAISEADAALIRGLVDSDGFDVEMVGYGFTQTFSNCVFEEIPEFPLLKPGFVGYNFTIYVPQGAI